MQRVFGISLHVLSLVFVFWLLRKFGFTLRRIAASQNEDPSSKTSVKKFSMEKGIKTTFHDIAGCANQKLEMSEFVDFLKNPQRYEAAGARLPKGALLGGPPGTGKTLMAKACAGESNVPFFYMSGSDFVEKYVGVGASRVRKLFEAARKEAPSIIFIDEIDAVGRERQGGGNQEGDSTLNQLLVEMDGFNSRDKVVVFAATNRADILDKALKRPGRFDRTIEFTLPNKEERVEIFKVHLRKIVTEERLEVISEKLAPICSGFSGADIMNLVNEAAIVAGRASKAAVELEDFEAAMERVVGGLKKVVKLDHDEKYQIAIHEAGKAVVSWYLKHTPALIKMSIIPRAKSNLGFSQYVEYEKKLQTEEELRDLICHKMGGRAAEELFFQADFTTSAQKDLRKCYELAYRIVGEFGMSKPLYNMILHTSKYGLKSYSEKTNQVADAEIKKIIDAEYARCLELITRSKDKVEKLANLLVEKEMVDVLAIRAILGDRLHESDDVSVTQALKDVETMLQQRQDDKAAKLAETEAKAKEEAAREKEQSTAEAPQSTPPPA